MSHRCGGGGRRVLARREPLAPASASADEAPAAAPPTRTRRHTTTGTRETQTPTTKEQGHKQIAPQGTAAVLAIAQCPSDAARRRLPLLRGAPRRFFLMPAAFVIILILAIALVPSASSQSSCSSSECSSDDQSSTRSSATMAAMALTVPIFFVALIVTVIAVQHCRLHAAASERRTRDSNLGWSLGDSHHLSDAVTHLQPPSGRSPSSAAAVTGSTPPAQSLGDASPPSSNRQVPLSVDTACETHLTLPVRSPLGAAGVNHQGGSFSHYSPSPSPGSRHVSRVFIRGVHVIDFGAPASNGATVDPDAPRAFSESTSEPPVVGASKEKEEVAAAAATHNELPSLDTHPVVVYRRVLGVLLRRCFVLTSVLALLCSAWGLSIVLLSVQRATDADGNQLAGVLASSTYSSACNALAKVSSTTYILCKCSSYFFFFVMQRLANLRPVRSWEADAERTPPPMRIIEKVVVVIIIAMVCFACAVAYLLRGDASSLDNTCQLYVPPDLAITVLVVDIILSFITLYLFTKPVVDLARNEHKYAMRCDHAARTRGAARTKLAGIVRTNALTCFASISVTCAAMAIIAAGHQYNVPVLQKQVTTLGSLDAAFTCVLIAMLMRRRQRSHELSIAEPRSPHGAAVRPAPRLISQRASNAAEDALAHGSTERAMSSSLGLNSKRARRAESPTQQRARALERRILLQRPRLGVTAHFASSPRAATPSGGIIHGAGASHSSSVAPSSALQLASLAPMRGSRANTPSPTPGSEAVFLPRNESDQSLQVSPTPSPQLDQRTLSDSPRGSPSTLSMSPPNRQSGEERQSFGGRASLAGSSNANIANLLVGLSTRAVQSKVTSPTSSPPPSRRTSLAINVAHGGERLAPPMLQISGNNTPSNRPRYLSGSPSKMRSPSPSGSAPPQPTQAHFLPTSPHQLSALRLLTGGAHIPAHPANGSPGANGTPRKFVFPSLLDLPMYSTGPVTAQQSWAAEVESAGVELTGARGSPLPSMRRGTRHMMNPQPQSPTPRRSTAGSVRIQLPVAESRAPRGDSAPAIINEFASTQSDTDAMA